MLNYFNFFIVLIRPCPNNDLISSIKISNDYHLHTMALMFFLPSLNVISSSKYSYFEYISFMTMIWRVLWPSSWVLKTTQEVQSWFWGLNKSDSRWLGRFGDPRVLLLPNTLCLDNVITRCNNGCDCWAHLLFYLLENDIIFDHQWCC